MTTENDWTSALPSIDLDGLQPVFNELAGEEKNAAIQLRGDRRFSRQPTKRTLVDARRVANAARHLQRLPDPGESIHMVVAGEYSLFDVIGATLQLAAPATISYLAIATLGFSRANLEQLLALIDADEVTRLDFLFSVYFKSNEWEICERLAHELTRRGQRALAMRSHAKILLLLLSDGRAFTVESSANLRSSRNVEQAVLTQDRPLLDFHRSWLNEIFMEHAR